MHEWIDDAQKSLGELHGLIHRTWFEPSTTPVGTVQVSAQSQVQRSA